MAKHREIEVSHHFDNELDEIRVNLVEMGTMVLANIRRAGVVLVENRLDDIDGVIAADLPIDEANEGLESKVFQILALQQPAATDLRFLVSSTRILYEMERSGDLAVNIVNSVNRIDGIPAEPVLRTMLGRLVEASATMFSRGVEAITTMDSDIGLGADAEDEETDRLTSELFSAVTARQDDLGLEASVALFYIGRFLERIADHGVNIAQNITFAVAGSFPEDY